MSKRRETMRVAGWLALLWGALAIAASIATDSLAVDLLGAYGVLFLLTGSWTLVGVALLARRERQAVERQVAARTMPNQSSVLGR